MEQVKSRGGRPAKYANQAERQAAYRARHGASVTVVLPADLKAELDAYLVRRQADHDADETLSGVIVKLLRSQLLRKR